MPSPPIPYTWSVADVASAALLNAQLFAGLQFLITPPRVQISSSVGQAIPTGTTFVSLSFNQEAVDSENGHASGSTRYICQVPGWYYVQGTCAFPASGTGNRSIQLAISGSTAPGTTIIQPAPTGNSWAGVTSGWLNLNVGDYVEVQVWQTSGGSLTTNTAAGLMPTLSAYFISN